jgi:hypothetical protein
MSAQLVIVLNCVAWAALHHLQGSMPLASPGGESRRFWAYLAQVSTLSYLDQGYLATHCLSSIG